MPDAAMNLNGRPVYVVDGARTPQLKAKGAPGPFAAADLAVGAGRPLLLRQPFEPAAFDEVVMGGVMPGPDEANIARLIALRLGLPQRTPAWTVQRNCASGMQALDSAAHDIAAGRAERVLTGGVGARARALGKLRPAYLAPVIGLLRGLTDPLVGLNMGQTAENLAYRFHIGREQMDAFALESHRRLAAAQDEGRLGEIEVLYDNAGKVYAQDDGLRRDGDKTKLAKLKPAFDKKFGNVTAANSAQISDGAALLILASGDAVKKNRLPVLGRIVDSARAGVDPAQMGLGPANAMAPLLKRGRFTVNDIDYWV